MKTPTRTLLVLAVMAAASLGFSGCWPFGPKSKDGKKPGAPAAAPAPAPAPAAAPRKQPPDEIGQLLADLDCGLGDPQRSWHAEERLAAMPDSVAERLRPAFSANTPEARAAACRLAYRHHDVGAVPLMIALLGDDSRLVRNTANVFLAALTGQDFDFRPDALPADRAAAQAKWQAWYDATYGPVGKPKRP